jgi:hypothetical protein
VSTDRQQAAEEVGLGQPLDEPAGDMADQASRLQMAQEQEAIAAALAGRVRGTDALEDRGPFVDPLEGREPLDDADDASDDPVHGGGREGSLAAELDHEVAITVPGVDSVVELDEGTTVDDDGALLLERDGDPDVLDEPSGPGATGLGSGDDDVAELDDLATGTHDPDDPSDPDGYGVPPARE